MARADNNVMAQGPMEPERRAVAADQLLAGERAMRYMRQLERPEVFPSRANWEYIIENRMGVLAVPLYRKYLMAWLTPEGDRSDYHDLAIEMMPAYVRSIDRGEAVDAVYADVDTASDAALALIIDCQLFDAESIDALLDVAETVPFAADCLEAYQPEYTEADLARMRELLRRFKNLPAIGEVSESRSVFGREVRYICPEGHSNPSNQEFCAQCGENIQGLTEAQVAGIERFEQRVEVLGRLLEMEGRNL